MKIIPKKTPTWDILLKNLSPIIEGPKDFQKYVRTFYYKGLICVRDSTIFYDGSKLGTYAIK
jgi:hypothetical protein